MELQLKNSPHLDRWQGGQQFIQMLYCSCRPVVWANFNLCSGRLPALTIASLILASATVQAFQFTNITTAAGITHTHSHQPNDHPHGFTDNTSWISGGAVAEDFNNDGLLDLYVLQGGASANLLYMNLGGGVFTNEASSRGVDLTHYGMGVTAADYDNDGDADILVMVRNAQPVLLQNNGAGIFNAATGVVDTITLTSSMSPSWGDVDNDGLLDLLLAEWGIVQGLHLLRNTGTALMHSEFRILPNTDMRMFSPRFADMNNDRRADIVAVGDYLHSQLYLNLGATQFGRVTTNANVGFDENGMGSAIGDYDNDGDLDWFVSSITAINDYTNKFSGHVGNRLYRNNGNGIFADVTETAGVQDGNWGWGSAFGDLDNDGDLDLYHVNGWPSPQMFLSIERGYFNNHPARLFENLGNGSFTNAAAGTGADDTGQGRGVLLFDFDEDGDLDIFICNNMTDTLTEMTVTYTPGPASLLRNDTPTSNHWLKVTLDGTPPLHRQGIGSRVYLTTGTTTQMRELHASTGFLSQGPGRIAHFGLGTNTLAITVRAEWNSGDAVIHFNVPTDQAITLPSPLATISKRRVLPGQPVTASAAAITHAVEWVVEGVPHADPVNVLFTNVGIHELTLNVYEAGGPELLWQEVLRVEVVGLSQIDSFARVAEPESYTLGWEADAGQLYHLESSTNLTAADWQNENQPTIQGSPGAVALTITNRSKSGEFFRIVVDPKSSWPLPE